MKNTDGDIYDPKYLEVLKQVNDTLLLTTGVDRAWMKSLWTPTLSLVNAVRQITAGSYEGNPKWLTIAHNQNVLNYDAQQASVNNPELFDSDYSMIPVIAYLSDHKAETLDHAVKIADEFAREHSNGDRQFMLAAGGAGIEAATDIVVRETNRTMLLYVYGAVMLLCSLPSAVGVPCSSQWCR